jgi:hypothetical protein
MQVFRFIILGNVCSFSTEPDSAVQPYSVVPSRVKDVHEFALDCIMQWIDRFLVGGVISNKLYHAVD